MLIIYRTATGEVVENTGTNTALPEGPPDNLAWLNIGDDHTGLALLRLHDVEDAELIDSLAGHHYTVHDERIVVGEAIQTPTPDPAPTYAPMSWAAGADARITALSAAVSTLMATQTLPDVDDDIFDELDDAPTANTDLDDILSELEGL